MMEYKGYIGRVEFDDDANIFHGEVINLRDVITFQGESVQELRNAFQESIDDYLAFCAERDEEPERPYSGTFTVRITPELHRDISVRAKLAEQSLNSWVSQLLEHEVKDSLNRDISIAQGTKFYSSEDGSVRVIALETTH